MSDERKTVDFGAPDMFGAHVFRVESLRGGRDRS